MMKVKALVIDDEEPARMLIERFLTEMPEVQLVGVSTDGFDAVKMINELKPDLIFLDVQMPRLSGFEVLEIVEHRPQVIFTTAFDSYAVHAFEQNAADYLLKPFSKDRFKQAVHRVIDRIKANTPLDYGKVIQHSDDKLDIIQRVAVRSGSKIEVIPVSEIFHIESDGDYVMIHSAKGKHLKEKTMKYFESHLDASNFVRVHRQSIINVNEISRIELFEKDSYVVKLKNGNQIKTSSGGYRLLKEVLNL